VTDESQSDVPQADPTDTPDPGVDAGEVEQPTPTARRGGRRPKADVTEQFVPALRRIVLYTTAAGTIRPAIITRVNTDDETVDLSVFNSEGCVAIRAASQGDAETPGTYFWE